METSYDEIASGWGVAFLSSGRANGYYEKLGWKRWIRLTFTETLTGVVLDGEHGGLMVSVGDPSNLPDRAMTVTYQDRPGIRDS